MQSFGTLRIQARTSQKLLVNSGQFAEVCGLKTRRRHSASLELQ